MNIIEIKSYRVIVSVSGRFQEDDFHTAEVAFRKRLKCCGVSAGSISFGVAEVVELAEVVQEPVLQFSDEVDSKEDELVRLIEQPSGSEQAEQEEVEQVESEVAQDTIDLRCSALTSRGGRCKYPRLEDSDFCKVHTKRLQEGEDQPSEPEPEEPVQEPEPDVIHGQQISGIDALKARLRG